MPIITRPMAHRRAKGVPVNAGGKSGGLPPNLPPDLSHEYRREIGRYIRAQRIAAGLTQAALGDLIGVGETTISSIEVGRGSVPPERYAGFIKALDLDAVEFGQMMLRFTNPWLYRLLVDDNDRKLKADLRALPERTVKGAGTPRP